MESEYHVEGKVAYQIEHSFLSLAYAEYMETAPVVLAQNRVQHNMMLIFEQSAQRMKIGFVVLQK